MELSTLQFDLEFDRVYESLQDISKQNVLYHYTGLTGLFGILETGKILPGTYGLNTDREIAVTRSKRPLSSIENSDVRITLFTDRIKTLRGVTVTGINEAEQEQRHDYEMSVARLLHLGNRPSTGHAPVLYSRRNEFMDDPETALNVISDLCMLDRRAISRRDLEDFLINLTMYAMIRNREYGNQFEERIRTTSGIPVDKDYLEIMILRSRVSEVPEGLTPNQCADLLRDKAAVFKKDEKFKELISGLSAVTRSEKKRDLTSYSSDALRKKYPAMFSA